MQASFFFYKQFGGETYTFDPYAVEVKVEVENDTILNLNLNF